MKKTNRQKNIYFIYLRNSSLLVPHLTFVLNLSEYRQNVKYARNRELSREKTKKKTVIVSLFRLTGKQI